MDKVELGSTVYTQKTSSQEVYKPVGTGFQKKDSIGPHPEASSWCCCFGDCVGKIVRLSFLIFRCICSCFCKKESKELLKALPKKLPDPITTSNDVKTPTEEEVIQESLRFAEAYQQREKQLSEARRAMSSQIQKLIEQYQEKLVEEPPKDLIKRIEYSNQIKKDLELIRTQIQELRLQASSLTFNRCEEQSQTIEGLLGMIQETQKSAQHLLQDQANAIYTNELLAQGWEIDPVPKNGNCLLLSLSGKNPHEAATLRKNLVPAIREKIITHPGDDTVVNVKWTIQSLMMDDLDRLVGYPKAFKERIQNEGVDFILSEEPGEGWQAYLDALAQDGAFCGEPELSVLHELLGANICVYQAKKPPYRKDEQGRLFVLDKKLASEYPESFVFSDGFFREWLNSLNWPQEQLLPHCTYPSENSPHDKNSSHYVILRDHHYEILKRTSYNLRYRGS
jgi:hypothetical protein